MWEAKSKAIDDNIRKMSFFENNAQLAYDEMINHWRNNPEFRNFYFSILFDSPFDAFFWENPPVTKSTIKQPYEFVMVNSPQLSSVSADANPFQEKFKTKPSNQNVITFENLGRDAELIVPCPITDKNVYAHIASFIRNAPESQKHNLFMDLAKSLNNRINSNPTWVSTSGLGVYWLHIRLDTKPKYYSYQPYRNYDGE